MCLRCSAPLPKKRLKYCSKRCIQAHWASMHRLDYEHSDVGRARKKTHADTYYSNLKSDPERLQKKRRRDVINGLRAIGVGITQELYDQLLSNQDSKCAICRRPPGRQYLAVDHDHETGEIRGLLCGTCNRALGLLRDSGEVLLAAYNYITRNHLVTRG